MSHGGGSFYSMAGVIGMISKLKAVLRTPFTVRLWRRLKQFSGFFGLLNGGLYDTLRYFKWCHGSGLERDRERQERALLKAYHTFEKGMSMQNPRAGFGLGKIADLMERIDIWKKDFPIEGTSAAAVDSLRSYYDFNQKYDVALPKLEAWLEQFPETAPTRLGGVEHITREQVLSDIDAGGASFFTSRHSMRNFGEAPVPMEAMREAADIARKTPSVCNRQGTAAYCFENAGDALQYQPGNRGFGHLASRALVVTADLRAFAGVGERYQAWIDGGLYAMSLMYALHSLGYGSCPLAWAADPATDKKARAALGIPDCEVIIMMIAVGSLPEEFNAAQAWRLPVEKSFRIVPAKS